MRRGGERVGDPRVGGKHVYWWYLVWKECGNLYLDMESATGSEVSGIRGGTATAVGGTPQSGESECFGGLSGRSL
jgi:hypothetical protein